MKTKKKEHLKNKYGKYNILDSSESDESHEIKEKKKRILTKSMLDK